MTLRDILMRRDLILTPSEEKIARLLLTDYPAAGLGSASNLARRAGVSDPTVLRLVMKLGFQGISDFQAKLLAEVEARLHSPLLMMESKRADGLSGDPVLNYIDSVSTALVKSRTMTPLQTYDRATNLIMDAKNNVLTLGGRFSRHLAGMLAVYLLQFRTGVYDIGAISAQAFDTLADLGRKDVLIVFDYRRYQLDVVSYARQAAARGVRILLFTDPWLSPIADHAEATIVSPLEAASPYDTFVPAVAQIEALVACILSTMGDDARARIELLEQVRHANGVTLDTDSQKGSRGKKTAKSKPPHRTTTHK
ncbi:sugar isomerase [Bradyrhizobium ottawaense]|uniref:MurR/RpiR family transcriptional regulator n=1 Tax=Bradyrhizobium ottawaense TaxID=931866 RepID=UPI000BEA5B59|nr:MurR/RpiR family transcriptional regulator [Bradyrhizobium ottawaense]PDT63993.1 sugar isomerase [Bradyrhizobium ottawaense]